MSAMNKKRTESTETLKKVLRFIGRYRILLVVSIVLAAASVLLQLYVPILFGNAIDQIIAEQKVNFSQMWRWLRQVLLVVLFSGAASWIMNLINNRIAYRTVQDIRAKAIRHIQKLSLSYLDSHSTGDIISRITADADILSDGLLLGFTQLFSGIVTIIGTLVLMERGHYHHGNCADAFELFCGKIYFFPLFPDVSASEQRQRTADSSY